MEYPTWIYGDPSKNNGDLHAYNTWKLGVKLYSNFGSYLAIDFYEPCFLVV